MVFNEMWLYFITYPACLVSKDESASKSLQSISLFLAYVICDVKTPQ